MNNYQFEKEDLGRGISSCHWLFGQTYSLGSSVLPKLQALSPKQHKISNEKCPFLK
jgi:hypothetical protein